MYCKKCGIQIPDQTKFCPRCGTNQQLNVESQPAATKPSVMYKNAAEHEKKPKRKKKVVLIAIIIIVVLAALGVGAIKIMPLFQKETGDVNEAKPTDTQAVVVPEETEGPRDAETISVAEPTEEPKPTETSAPAETPAPAREVVSLDDFPEPEVLETLTLRDDGKYISGDYVFAIEDGVASLYSYEGQATVVSIPTTVSYEDISYKIRTIGQRAFEGNVYLQTLVIPKSVTQIKEGAFKDCTNLQTIVVNGDIGDCDSDCTWNEGSAVFYNAGANSDSLTLVFGDEVTYVPAYLFRTPASKSDGTYAHVTDIVFSDSITEIGKEAFYGCFDLKNITWSQELRSIGSNAFANDTGLKELNLPERLTSIGGGAFTGCSALASIDLPGTLTILENGAFNDCTSLSSITIRSDIADCDSDSTWNTGSSIFYNAGANADSLKVIFTEGVTAVPEYLFTTPASKSDGTYAHVTDIRFSDSVELIGSYAFYGCHDLENISWGSGLREISGWAFAENTSLMSLVIPEGVTTIYYKAFENCSSLESVEFPESLTIMRSQAFANCVALNSITIKSDIDECDSDSTWNDNSAIFVNVGAYADSLVVTFADTVTSIPAYLFSTPYDDGESLYAHVTSVVLSEGVQSIGRNVFYNCHDLTAVEYLGSEGQYDDISIGEENECFTSVVPQTNG